MKVGRISRIVQLLTTLQSGQGYSANELAELLGVSRRTLFRDLAELAAIGVPYHFDAKCGGYRIDPAFFLPPIDLTLPEALSLLLLVHRAGPELPLPFKNSALVAGLKVENNLPAGLRQYCNTALRYVTVRTGPQAPMDLLDQVFGRLQEAIHKRRKVRLVYHSLFDGEGRIELVLSPYHLMFHRRAWYVIGHSSRHDSVRTFKLNRIQKLEVLDKCFLDGEAFDLNDYLGRAWAMIPEGHIHEVRLRFEPKVATNVSEVQWHSTQQVHWQSDGSVILEFRVDGLGEIAWWILGYGDQVEVLAPEALRQRVAETAARMVARYRSK